MDNLATSFVTGEGLSKETSPRAYELVHSMRNLCQLKRPEVIT